MTRRALFLFFAGAAIMLAQANPDWHTEFPAFQIAGNLYYVGTADLAVYLIHTPKGNILINSDFEQDLPLIKKSIEQLGFKYSDTKIILISHAHGDHDAATGVIKKETGAKLMVMDADVPEEESTAPGRPGAHVDRVLHDRETVELGGSKLVAHLTPGHTKGCTTWTMQERDGARTLNVVIIGSPNVNPGYILVGNKNYPQIADDYVKTFAVLKSLPCDVFLGAHGAYFGLKEKYAKMKAGAADAFVDPEGYKAYVAERDDTFRKEWERQKKNPGSAAPSAAMPPLQQNALVQKYCAVCHTDASRNGGLSLEHFDAAHPDPGVAAMMLGKLKTGAIGAADLKPPNDATVQAWIRATSAETAGADRWNVQRTQDPATKASIVSASIVRELPSARIPDVPDSYRLTVACRADTREAEMEFAWSPASPKAGQVFSAFVDGKALSTYKVEGTETMGNGTGGSSGPGSIILYPTRKDSPAAKLAMALPADTLTIRDAFPNETVVFPFGELTQNARQALSTCFAGTIASR